MRACSANWVPARGASFLLAEYRAQNPASAPPRRGFDFSQSGMAGILRSMIRSHLAQTNRYIAELKTDIAREHAIVEDALDMGQSSDFAQSLLHALEESLRIFERHRELIFAQLQRQPSEQMYHPSATGTRRAGTCHPPGATAGADDQLTNAALAEGMRRAIIRKRETRNQKD